MNKYTRLSFFGALFALLLAFLFTACGSVPGTGSVSAAGTSTGGAGNSTSNGIAKATTSSTSFQSASAAASTVPLKVTGVDMGLNPSTLRNLPCGSNVTETYTATFHFPVNNVGGPVTFEYTVNNGRASQVVHIIVRPGQTSLIYAFRWSGQLDAASTLPGRGGVLVTVPNAYTSDLVAPLGPCMPAPVAAPLKVTSVDMGLNPPTLRNLPCGSNVTETYTATFHFPVNNVGGPVTFEYTVNNGRASQVVHFTVRPGQTSITYAFHWSGQLDAASTLPGRGGVLVTAPNAYTSDLVAPLGPCMPAPVAAPLKVTGVDMGINPSTLRNLPCGSNITETYTATFHFPVNNVGGPVTFEYTVNNGRASQVVHITVRPGQTSLTYAFRWSGQLDAASTLPGRGGVLVTAPNAYTSNLIAPLGPCMSR